jgi:hypothetical protein
MCQCHHEARLYTHAILHAVLHAIFIHFYSRHGGATYRPIARQRLGKCIPSGANAHKNKTYVARQLFSKHASLTSEAVFSAWSVQSGYK